MEKKVNNIYEEAYSDISEKWNKFMNSHYPKLDRAIQDLREAEKSSDAAAIKEAKDVYERTAKNIVVNNRRFSSMAEETAAKISHTNEIALAYVNDQLPEIYTTNYNAFGEEKIKGYSFSLVNESAVKELAKSDKTLLPKKKLDIPKDMQWNKKLINSQMIQGILQGENIPTMAKRLMNVTDMNRVSAIRNARTMTTAAENKGRQDSYKRATEDGVIMKRIWVATTDDRTRAWHADLDGVAVDVDEPWDNEYGQIMYPGDPSADPANVYNCRCSIRTHIEGFRWNEELEETEKEEVKPEAKPEKSSVEEVVSSDSEDRYVNFKNEPINGVERGKPMTLDEADNGNVNPNYGASGYGVNCQTCVGVYEARIRGYNVEALPMTHDNLTMMKLSKNPAALYVDPDTGKNCKYNYKMDVRNADQMLEYMKSMAGLESNDERWIIGFQWAERTRGGHVVNFGFDSSGNIMIKDNQRGKGERSEWIGDKDVREYLQQMRYPAKGSYDAPPGILRVDDKDFDYDIASKIMKGKSQ